MSRRLILGLQQTISRSFGPSQQASHLQQPAVSTVCPFLKCLEGNSARQLATAAAQTHSAPTAGSNKLSESSARQLDTVFPLLQQSKPPEEQYSFIARTTGPYSVKRKAVFAVVELGPTQFKVAPDDLVYSEKLNGVDVGDKVSLNRVLLLGNRSTTVIGRPLVPEATVTAIVEVRSCFSACIEPLCRCFCTSIMYILHLLQEQFLNGKVLVFKKRRRKNSRRLNGHRQVSKAGSLTEDIADI